MMESRTSSTCMVVQRKADKKRGWETSNTCMVVQRKADKKRVGRRQAPNDREESEEGVDDELIENEDRVKVWRFGKSLNSPLTKAVMATITPHVDMRVVVVYATSIKEMVA